VACRRVNPRLLKMHRSYSVPEAARVLGVHKNSVRSWIKAGLPTVDKSRPTLMLGSEMRAWLERKRKAAKRPCLPGMLYCFKCRQPMLPALDMIEYIPFNATTGNLNALCGGCGTVMHRRARLDCLSTKMPNLDVQIREASLRLRERNAPSLNCDNRKD